MIVYFNKWTPTKSNPHFWCINFIPSFQLIISKNNLEFTFTFLVWSLDIHYSKNKK